MELTTEILVEIRLEGFQDLKVGGDKLIIRSVCDSRLLLVGVKRANECDFQACLKVYPTFWLRPPLLSSGSMPMLNAVGVGVPRAARAASNPWGSILGGGV